jgi:hypothetical protein
MRPQNGKRGRSRGRKGGGGHNNFNRTLESNGPDVKIRGSAAHIHEKYLALARDAHSSGDRVSAENYLQHAEHYHRLIMAALPPGQSLPYGQGQQSHFNGQADSPEDEADMGPETGEALPPQYHPPRRDDSQSYQQPREQGGYREQGGHREQGGYRGERDFQQREHQGREHQQPRDGQQPREQREFREQGQGQGPRGPRPDRGEGGFQDRRLNGRSRRVTDERGNGRPITSLETPEGAAPAPASRPPAEERPADDSDEALA